MFLFVALFIAALIAQLLVPVWWAYVPVAVVAGYVFGRKPGQAFWNGLGAIAALWFVIALLKWMGSTAPLGERMATLLPAFGSTLYLNVLLALVGGLVGGVAAAAGCALRRAIRPTEA